MSDDWVVVLKTGKDAEAALRAVLEEAGLEARIRLRSLPGTRWVKQDALEVAVRPDDEDAARQVIDAHLAEGEARIEKHMERLPGEMAAGAGMLLAVGGCIWGLLGGDRPAWTLAAAGVLLFAGGRMWLRRRSAATN